MFEQRLIFALVFMLGVLLIGQRVSARTRYMEYDYKACAEGGSAADSSDSSCAQYCQQAVFGFGGCDCVTNKCVCADMQLDFCRFEEIRKYI